ncbi:hypothetical protein CKO51_06065 [Rhodopirellula sp. SM50]|nr:serine/threonine-protein kinase [Rhodopirellula sp. SM50]PAY20399.1 hypothetical protein CKO51_06065 [Rhodopirellula sp. SM50]
MFDSSRLAAQAYRLNESQRADWVRKHCQGDPVKEAELRAKLSELDRLSATLPPGAVQADPDETVDPGRTPDRIAATNDAFSVDFEGPDADQPTLDTSFDWDLGPDEQLQAEEILDRFESDCSSDEIPDWSSYLPADLSDSIKRYLAHHLVVLDLTYRDKKKLPIDSDSYLSRLPEFEREIRAAITLRRQATKTPVIRRGNSDENEQPSTGDWHNLTPDTADARYVPGKMHAKGGLGAVYRGRDTELGRTVALKRILSKYEHLPECRDRFVFEAEVTGSLEHPGIVPIYGLCTYEDGKPYYAMRFIRGRSFGSAITEFHRQHSPLTADAFDSRAFRGLLRRLIECCNAMHYAHERGVVHRDLKPDNVMLGPYGETLVVDWGLAMILCDDKSASDTDQDIDHTPLLSSKGSNVSEGTTVGTPSYMSPEQANGVHQHLTRATDLYALGAILFRLTSNKICVDGDTLLDVITNVRDGKVRDLHEILPVAPRAIASICRRAMAFRPSDRYQTAVELAEDIDRWMNDEAVLAHAEFETVREKAGRMIRRYRSWTLSAAVALIAITIIAIGASVFIERAKAREEVAKDQAERFKGEAVDRYRQSRQAIDTWLVQSNDALQYFPGTRSVRARLLTLAAEEYEALAGEPSEDPEIELERIRALIRFGDLQQTNTEYENARETYTRAIKSIDSVLREQRRPDFLAERGHATSRIGLSWSAEDRTEKAKLAFTSAIEQLNAVSAPHPTSVSRYLAAAHLNYAESVLRQNDFDRAAEHLDASMETITRIGNASQSRDTMTKSRATELLARLMLSRGDLQGAIEQLNRASDSIRKLVHDEPDHPEFADSLASLLILRASIARQMGDQNREQDSLREAVDLYKRLQAAIPDLPIYQENLALTLTDLGLMLYEQHLCVDAKPLLEESIALMQSLSRTYGSTLRYRDTIAATQDGLGQVLRDLGEMAAAQEHLAASLTTYQELVDDAPDLPDFYERLAITQSHLAQTLARSVDEMSDDDEAKRETISMMKDGFASARNTLQQLCDVFPDVPQYRDSLAHVCFEQARALSIDLSPADLSPADVDAANEAWADAERIWEALSEHGEKAASERLAWLLLSEGGFRETDFDAAVNAAQEAYEAQPGSILYQGTLALSYVANHQLTPAEALTETWGNEETFSGRQWRVLSILAAAKGRFEMASAYRQRCQNWYEQHAPAHRERDLRFAWEQTSPK